MNLASKTFSITVIALAIGLNTACWSSDATPVTNEPANSPATAATASPPPTDEPKRQMAVVAALANLSEASSADGNLPEDQRWCLAWALDNLQPHVYAEFRQLDPATMDDLDRTVWRPRLEGNLPRYQSLPTYDHHYGAPKITSWANLVGTCWMYWSEPMNKTNAEKRNDQYEGKCLKQAADAADSRWDELASAAVQYDDDTAYDTPNQYVRVLQWMDTPGQKLLETENPPHETLKRLANAPWAYDGNIPSRERMKEAATEHGPVEPEYWGLLNATLAHRGSRIESCQSYYPQLYYGYWVPFAKRIDEPPEQLSDEETAEVERIRNGPIYLPRPR